MITTRALLAGVAGAALLAGVAASDADAAPVTITGTSGIWENTVPGVTGEGSNTISWGTPANGSQSSYVFDGVPPPAQAFDVPPDQGFVLGFFTHNNFPITGTTLQSAELVVTTNLTIDGNPQAIESTFEFFHDETTNTLDPCPHGGANDQGVNINGCADEVTFSFLSGESDQFEIDGVLYNILISGFQLLDENGDPVGGVVNEFLTTENLDNTAQLIGTISAIVPGEVPEPASLALLGAGLAGLGFMARRRRLV